MVKNIKLKRKAKKLKLMRISWYQHLNSNIMFERLLSQHQTYIENLINYRIRLRKQIIKCKTK